MQSILANGSNAGSDWSSGELDIIVTDYLQMLGLDVSRHRYNKAEHNRKVQTLTGRSRPSVEYKYQNISSVLEKLGMPWIFGYKPMHNYQTAIIDAIERHLKGSVTPLEQALTSPNIQPRNEIFVAPPVRIAERLPERLQQLVRKYDPTERDRRNHDLGERARNLLWKSSVDDLPMQADRISRARSEGFQTKRGTEPATILRPSL